MSLERNKQIIRRLIDAHMHHDAAQVGEILSPSLVWHTGGEAMGRDDYLAGLEMGARAFSDQVTDIELIIAEDDRVAVYLDVRMRHTGEFEQIAPSGRTIRFAGAWFYRIADDRVVEAWNIDDDVLGKLREAAQPEAAGVGVPHHEGR